MAQLNQFRVRRFALSIPALPRTLDGTTIAHVSDMHVGILSGVQALYAEDQAKSARRQADAAELANTGEELTALNMAEPKFEWMPPTGSRDGIDISFKNVGGLVQLIHAEVKSGTIDTPLQIPGGKISSGQTIRLHFKPPVEDQSQFRVEQRAFREANRGAAERRNLTFPRLHPADGDPRFDMEHCGHSVCYSLLASATDGPVRPADEM